MVATVLVVVVDDSLHHPTTLTTSGVHVLPVRLLAAHPTHPHPLTPHTPTMYTSVEV